MADSSPSPAGDWLAKAHDDLCAARMIVEGRGPTPVACFLCQQAIEKSLKAVLVASGAVPPRTHDVEELASRCADAGHDLALDPDLLADASLFAVAPRYPGFPTAEADAAAPRLLAFAETVRAAVTTIVET